ncbi:MAG: thioesterase family protein [Acidimicrobiales bacterium]
MFDDETAVERAGPGEWSAAISSAWNIGEVPNGGYSLAIVLGAIARDAGHVDPLSVTCHFLRPVGPGRPAIVTTDVVRSGRTVSTVCGRLRQDGKERLVVMAAMGDLAGTEAAAGGGTAGDEPTGAGPGGWADVEPPDLPPPDRCVARTGDAQGVALALRSRVEVRLHPDQAEPGVGGDAEMSGWIRFADGRPPDARGLVLFADAFPPSLFGRLGRVGWVPTIELTVHVRRRPAPGWVMGRFRCDDLDGGRMIEDGALWDADGRLVARARQLGLLL